MRATRKPSIASALPLSRLSRQDLAREVIARGIVAQISGATIWRWLDQDAIRPWQHRGWIFPRDPQFEQQAGRVLDLYQGCWQNQALGSDDYVISADEKTSIQARVRIHPTQPTQAGQSMRVEFEYERGGALAYLAAWDDCPARRLEPPRGGVARDCRGELTRWIQAREHFWQRGRFCCTMSPGQCPDSSRRSTICSRRRSNMRITACVERVTPALFLIGGKPCACSLRGRGTRRGSGE